MAEVIDINSVESSVQFGSAAGGYRLRSGGATTKWYMYNPASSTELRFYDGTHDHMFLTNGELSL